MAAQVHLLTMSQAVRPALMERPAVENCGQGGRRQAERGGGHTFGCEAGSGVQGSTGNRKAILGCGMGVGCIKGNLTGQVYWQWSHPLVRRRIGELRGMHLAACTAVVPRCRPAGVCSCAHVAVSRAHMYEHMMQRWCDLQCRTFCTTTGQQPVSGVVLPAQTCSWCRPTWSPRTP